MRGMKATAQPLFPPCGPGRYVAVIDRAGVIEVTFLGQSPANDTSARPSLRVIPGQRVDAVPPALRPFILAMADLITADIVARCRVGGAL